MTSTTYFILAGTCTVALLVVMVAAHLGHGELTGKAPATLLLAAIVAGGVGVGTLTDEGDRDTRIALEARYDVDIEANEVRGMRSEQELVINGDLYECLIKGNGDDARMYCDEPPRPEFESKD